VICDVFVPFILLLVSGINGKGNNRKVGKNDIIRVWKNLTLLPFLPTFPFVPFPFVPLLKRLFYQKPIIEFLLSFNISLNRHI